jgi:hypothetical protein
LTDDRLDWCYIVITTKHHDGVCMFDAAGTDYKITRTPYGRDVLAMLAERTAPRPSFRFQRRRAGRSVRATTMMSTARGG